MEACSLGSLSELKSDEHRLKKKASFHSYDGRLKDSIKASDSVKNNDEKIYNRKYKTIIKRPIDIDSFSYVYCERHYYRTKVS